MSNLAWGGHQNGRIPTSVLTPIGPGALSGGLQFGKEQYAHPAAAAAWFRLRDAVQQRTGLRMGVAEGYRDFALQQHYWNTLPFPRAASPGTSNHGWARAIDMHGYNSAALAAVRELGPGFGWSLATGDRVGEPWHIEYVGSLTVPATQGEDPMTTVIARWDDSGACFLWNTATNRVQSITDTYRLGLLQRLFRTVHFAEGNQFNFTREQYSATMAIGSAAPPTAAQITTSVVAALRPIIEQAGSKPVTVDEKAIAAAVAAALPPTDTQRLMERIRAEHQELVAEWRSLSDKQKAEIRAAIDAVPGATVDELRGRLS